MSGGLVAAAVIGAGATAYASHKASKEASKQRKQDQPIIDQQKKMLEQLQPYGTGFLNSGRDTLDQVKNYWSALGSGDRAKTLQAVAPEINGLTQQAQGSVAAQRGLYPRGGMSASAASQLPYTLQGNINNLMFGVRPQAMQQLGQLGTNTSSLGLSALGQGAGLTNSMLDYGLAARNQQFQQGNAMGQGIASMLGAGMNAYALMNANRGSQLNPNANPGSYSGGGLFGGSSPYSGAFSGFGNGAVSGSSSYGNYLPPTSTTSPSNSNWMNIKP